MKTYEIKRGHGYYPGKQEESDTIGTIDTGMQFQHTLVGIYDDYNHCVVPPDNAETVQTQYYKQHRGNILLIKNATKQGYLEAEEGDGIDISSRMEYHRGTVQKGKVQTLNCGGGYGVVTNESENLRIRKLTPKECFRLMGVKDEDSDKLKGMSDMNLYHLAGDSIIVDVLMAIFKKML